MPALTIHDWPLPYDTALAERPLDAIDLVVIHCTELPDLAMAREYGERVLYDDGTGASGHYYIDRSGATYCFVGEHRVAHHTRGFNQRSIGIELVNTGRYPNWLDSRHQEMREPYSPAQIDSLAALIDTLRDSLPSLALIAGHEDLDTTQVPASDDAALTVPRKRDPGPLFPWDDILARCRLERLQPPRK
ncbi:MAG TPA: N-acetylmuramoyl-L-alanine amidase [Rhodanobacteraceae bacterium]|nr:N-acetylmuramoyl-L-alanine amidase [Rhodanobacteraceae bacterium]